MKHDKLPVAVIAVMFLTIGVMFCMNDILLPVVREAFNLSYLEATFIQISFYIVYLIWPLAISSAIGKYGYRKNIIAAMAICFAGCMMFVPAIIFPTIFSLSIDGLRDFTGNGSALLNFAIVGGAVFPPLQGVIADLIELSYIVPAFCILIVTFYGMFMHAQKRERPPSDMRNLT